MPTLPFEKLPVSRPDPAALIQQQFDKASKQLDVEWENKYRDLNQKYDWNRQDHYPDEIEQARGALRNQIEGQRQKLQTQYSQQIGQFNLVDQLLSPDQAEQVKWRMLAGPEVAGRMFPKQKSIDWRLEHQRTLLERGRLMDLRDSYALDSKGRLYGVDPGTGRMDKSLPATQAEFQGWMQGIAALESLDIYEREQILPNLTTVDIMPTRLQEIMLGRREKSWREKMGKRLWKAMGWTPGLRAVAKAKEVFETPETPGTFADKVSATMTQPIVEPRIREPEEKITRKQLLTEYRRLGGGGTTEGRAFADRYLK